MVRGRWWVVLQNAFRVLLRPNGNAILGGRKTADVWQVSDAGKAAAVVTGGQRRQGGSGFAKWTRDAGLRNGYGMGSLQWLSNSNFKIKKTFLSLPHINISVYFQNSITFSLFVTWTNEI
ncbi:hypothetical protein V8G54_031876 [Vigna mungo]|uniref:Uncharacterized protein n=1 Tax=Vigna mungo TaxID=3915 RepID=A0AAQ3RHC3_VIGMU